MKSELLKSYPDYKASGIQWLGDLPAHWDVTRLKQVCSRYGLYGANLSADNYQETGVRFLRTTDITDIGTLKGDGVFLPSELVRDYMLNDGDLLISRSGTVGRSFLYQSNLHGLCSHAGYLVRFVPNSFILPKYLFFFTKTVEFADFLKTSVISSTIENVNADKYAKAHLPLPSISEQANIVHYLDHVVSRIQRYINAKKRLIELLEEERRINTLSAIQSLNTASPRLEAVADLVERPVKRVSDKTYISIGLYNRGRGIFLKDPRKGSELGDSDFFWLEEGDLVISGQFAWEGAIALVSDIEHGCIASHRFPILKSKPGKLDAEFLLSFLQTAWGQLLLDHNSRGAAGRNRPLNVRSLMKEKISLPPIEAQRRISDMLQREALARKQVNLMEQLLTEYRTRLISDVVTGKLDVRGAIPEEIEVPTP